MLEAKLKHDWAKKGAIKIIDAPRDYYQVLFTLDEDYNHALMEGLWIVGITILWYSVGDHFFQLILVWLDVWLCGFESRIAD